MNHSSSVQPSAPSSARRHAAWRILAALILTQGVWTATPVLAKPEAAKPVKLVKEKEDYGYSQMLKDVDNGNVSKIVDVTGETRRTLKVAFKGKAITKDVLMFDSLESNRQLYEKTNFFKRLAAANVSLESQPRAADNSGLQSLLFQLGLLVLALFALSAIIKRSANASGQAMNFGKSRARFQMQAKTGVMFDDVAGVNEAKEELAEVVTFLQQPEKFTALGAKIPRGVLLVGSPGTGKTLMAKAIAGEAGVPFFSISGSEFVEMFVGVGASRVRDLFKKAKENAPCLIFIDEIDAVGRQRGVGIGGGNDEREQTLNQLLTEMDGFEGNLGVIVIAATNRPDVLDAALLRPGRFDRQVTVDLPDYKGRLSILEVHARTKKIQEGLSLESVARRTIGFSGADLANMLNEAAIFTARRRKEAITIQEIDDAIDRVQAGMEGKAIIDGKFKRQTAYHEIGHALLITLLPEHDPLHKVTVIPRGRAIGLTWSTPAEEFGLENRTKLLSRIMVSLGGRVAEEIVFGETEVDSGADSDIQQLTRIARFMVSQVGMSKLGLVAMNTDEQDYSEDIAAQIDREMRAIVKKCHQQATEILKDYRPLMDSLVDVLIDQETIDGDEFRELVDKYIAENGKTPRPKAAEPVAV